MKKVLYGGRGCGKTTQLRNMTDINIKPVVFLQDHHFTHLGIDNLYALAQACLSMDDIILAIDNALYIEQMKTILEAEAKCDVVICTRTLAGIEGIKGVEYINLEDGIKYTSKRRIYR